MKEIIEYRSFVKIKLKIIDYLKELDKILSLKENLDLNLKDKNKPHKLLKI